MLGTHGENGLEANGIDFHHIIVRLVYGDAQLVRTLDRLDEARQNWLLARD